MFLLHSLFFQVRITLLELKSLFTMFRSSLSYLSSVHHEGDVAEVGVGEGGQEADAPAD